MQLANRPTAASISPLQECVVELQHLHQVTHAEIRTPMHRMKNPVTTHGYFCTLHAKPRNPMHRMTIPVSSHGYFCPWPQLAPLQASASEAALESARQVMPELQVRSPSYSIDLLSYGLPHTKCMGRLDLDFRVVLCRTAWRSCRCSRASDIQRPPVQDTSGRICTRCASGRGGGGCGCTTLPCEA